MSLTRRGLSDANLLRLFLTHPLLTIKVIGTIHWEAIRVRLKGATFHPRPTPPSHNITVVRPKTVVT